ncbi:MAG TPA: glycerophosphodiester phosphodiesterase family protein, partial [Burkholderiaceae bacterium]
ARFAGEPVPALTRALDTCRALHVWANVEIKPAPGAEAPTGTAVARTVAAAYAGELRAGGDRARALAPTVPLLSSFAPEALSAARLAVPDLPRALLCGGLPRDWRARLDGLGCVSLHCDHRRLERAQAQAVKRAGFWLLCYTVDDRERALELMTWGVDAVCTDRIDLIEPDLGPAQGSTCAG